MFTASSVITSIRELRSPLLAVLFGICSVSCGAQATSIEAPQGPPPSEAPVATGDVAESHVAEPSPEPEQEPSKVVEVEEELHGTGPLRLDTPQWLSRAIAAPIGDTFVPPLGDELADVTLPPLGFRLTEDKITWIRDANLLLEQPLIASVMPELPQIDAIAMISTFRPYLKDQYVYPTLLALFRALPAEAMINILVGNAQTDYLNADVLEAKIGADFASRVHIIVSPESTSTFFDATDAWVGRRATWNYARALRSYRGSKNLLLVEDDIDISPGALTQVGPYLDADVTGIYLLYNDRCKADKPLWAMPNSSITIHPDTIRVNSQFPTTQAIIYSAQITRGLGDYLMVRAGRESYDYMTGRYLADFRYVIGYVYPSVVQHMGIMTSGLSAPGHAPYSWCFDPNI